MSSHHELGFKIEDIIAELHQDVNAAKYKGLQEVCGKASGNFMFLYVYFSYFPSKYQAPPFIKKDKFNKILGLRFL